MQRKYCFFKFNFIYRDSLLELKIHKKHLCCELRNSMVMSGKPNLWTIPCHHSIFKGSTILTIQLIIVFSSFLKLFTGDYVDYIVNYGFSCTQSQPLNFSTFENHFFKAQIVFISVPCFLSTEPTPHHRQGECLNSVRRKQSSFGQKIKIQFRFGLVYYESDFYYFSFWILDHTR